MSAALESRRTGISVVGQDGSPSTGDDAFPELREPRNRGGGGGWGTIRQASRAVRQEGPKGGDFREVVAKVTFPGISVSPNVLASPRAGGTSCDWP